MVESSLKLDAEAYLCRSLRRARTKNLKCDSRGLAALEAFSAVGALSDEDVRRWRLRLATPHEAASTSAVTDETRTRARKILAAQAAKLGPLLDGSGRPPLEADQAELARRLERYHALRAILEALRGASAIDDVELQQWQERAERQVGLANESKGTSGVGMTTSVPADLLDVWAGPDATVDGMRVLAIERYSDCLVIAWYASSNPLSADRFSSAGSRQDRGGGPLLEVSDDSSTAYTRAQWSSGGFGSATLGHTTFVPAVPAGATRLSVRLGDIREDITLQR